MSMISDALLRSSPPDEVLLSAGPRSSNDLSFDLSSDLMPSAFLFSSAAKLAKFGHGLVASCSFSGGRGHESLLVKAASRRRRQLGKFTMRRPLPLPLPMKE